MAALTVIPAAPHERARALAMLFSRHAPAERAARVEDALAAAAHGELSLQGLLTAWRETRIVGASLVVLPDRGGTAFVWPPAVAEGDDAAADALLQETGRRLDASGAALAQCLLEPGEEPARDILTRNGFAHLADLLCMERRLDRPLPSRADPGLRRTSFEASDNMDRFAQIIEQTYVGTLDCPALVGRRSGREALESHRQSGVFDPRLWSVYAREQKDVAVLLLTEHPEENAREIVYLGVVPESRGRGYGRALVIDALHRAKDAGRSSLQLAVDCRNRFARRVYDELAFEEVASRAAYVRARRAGR
jgi:ribosomal protein S18 acetylase RimI-like enzyme